MRVSIDTRHTSFLYWLLSFCADRQAPLAIGTFGLPARATRDKGAGVESHVCVPRVCVPIVAKSIIGGEMFRAPCDANTYNQIIATGFVSAFEIGKGGTKVPPGEILYGKILCGKTMAAKGKIQTTICKIQNGYLKEHFKNESRSFQAHGSLALARSPTRRWHPNGRFNQWGSCRNRRRTPILPRLTA